MYKLKLIFNRILHSFNNKYFVVKKSKYIKQLKNNNIYYNSWKETTNNLEKTSIVVDNYAKEMTLLVKKLVFELSLRGVKESDIKNMFRENYTYKQFREYVDYLEKNNI